MFCVTFAAAPIDCGYKRLELHCVGKVKISTVWIVALRSILLGHNEYNVFDCHLFHPRSSSLYYFALFESNGLVVPDMSDTFLTCQT